MGDGFWRTLRGPKGRDALDKTSNLRNTSRGSVFLRPRDATNSAILRSSTSSVISSISARNIRSKGNVRSKGIGRSKELHCYECVDVYCSKEFNRCWEKGLVWYERVCSYLSMQVPWLYWHCLRVLPSSFPMLFGHESSSFRDHALMRA